MSFLIRFSIIAIALVLAGTAQAGVKDSLHNLSAAGPGNVKSGLADRICVYCHVSHSADNEGPLWSRRQSAASYIPYASSTAVAQPGQPTGSSVLCLSCHDGTIALGEVIGRGKGRPVDKGFGRMPPGKGLQGTDLRDDHPISFQYSADLATQNGELAVPGALDRNLPLDSNGELQCTTCHDSHDSPYESMLRVTKVGSKICVECHLETGWTQSSHSQSVASWDNRPPNPWRSSPYSTVSDNGCQNCHVPHNEAGGPRLLIHAQEEDNCADCHNGNVASKDVMASFDFASSHRVEDTTQVHDPVEPAVIEARHVECADCHDPHATRASRGVGELPFNVRGVNLGGAEVSQVTSDYELCLRCHGDSSNQPPARTPRQHDQANMRLKIQSDNPSFHPVTEPGRNNDVPSLIFPLDEQSVFGCAGCHNSSDAVSVGGTGPEGPHGSEYAPLLARNYSVLDYTPESEFAYALCYGCHSRDSILNNESFKHHDKHVTGQDVPCNACHDPHGISSTQGNEINNSHLINFDTSIVLPNSNNQLLFEDTGQQSGTCNLLCHGDNHVDVEY